MNRADLIETLAQHLNGDRGEAAEVLDTPLQTITYEIAAGGKVAVAGFGSFETVARPARVIKDPRTGRSRRVKARPVTHCRPAVELRDYASGVKNRHRRRSASRLAAPRTLLPAGCSVTPRPKNLLITSPTSTHVSLPATSSLTRLEVHRRSNSRPLRLNSPRFPGQRATSQPDSPQSQAHADVALGHNAT